MTHQTTITVETRGPGLTDITAKIAAIVHDAHVSAGLCHIFVRHTSASLLIQENADPAVLRDLQRFFEHLAPERPSFGAWEHDDEGPDDMPAHAKAAITRTSEVVPIRDGLLALGMWQGIYVVEHRARPHRRELIVTVMG